MTRKAFLARCFRAAMGIVVMACGIYLMIQANLGVHPWDVLTLGIVKQTGMLYGNVSIIIGISVVCIDLIMREKIGIGTLLDVFLCGKIVDLLNWLNIVPLLTNIWLSVLSLFAGMLLMCVSQYIYMKEGIGCGPRDALQVGIGKRLPKVNISVILGVIMLTVLVIGWFMGGPVGIGTVIIPFGSMAIQGWVFKVAKFDPKSIEHADLIQACKIICE